MPLPLPLATTPATVVSPAIWVLKVSAIRFLGRALLLPNFQMWARSKETSSAVIAWLPAAIGFVQNYETIVLEVERIGNTCLPLLHS